MKNNSEDPKPPPPPVVMNPNNTNTSASTTNNTPMNYKKNYQNPVHYNKSGNTNQVMNRNYHNGNFSNTMYSNNPSVPYGTNNNYVAGSYNSNRVFNYPNFSNMHNTNTTGGVVNPPRVNTTNVNYFMNQNFTVSKIPQPPPHVNMNVSNYNKNTLKIQKGIPPAPPAPMVSQNNMNMSMNMNMNMNMNVNMNMNMNSYIPPAPPAPAPAPAPTPAPPPPPLPMNMMNTKRDQRNYSEEYTGMQRHSDTNNVYVHNNSVGNSLHNLNAQSNYKEDNKKKGGDQSSSSYVQASEGNQTNQSGNKKNEGKNTTCNINVAGRERLQNDYNQHFVNSGERPQNFIRDSDENKRFIKYPKLKQLLELKNVIIQKRSTPARYISCDLRTFDLNSLGIKFDVILIDPPWKEYYDRKVHHLAVLNNSSINQSDLSYDLNDERDRYWSLEEIASLQIEKIAEVPSFIFLWCGVTHLEDARYLLNRWGYRRCEDVCWLKTNIQEKNKRVKYLNEINNENSYLQRTTEHCLMGIKGAVRRSYDIHLIHANLDTDVIIAEETEENIYDNNKPQELYKIIEKFCLGRRKIELFGTNRNIRNGWLTLGKNIDTTLFNKDEYISWFEGDIAWPEAKSYIGGKYMGTTNEIENLRPKSPTRNVHS